MAHLFQYGIEARAAHAGLVLVEQGIVRVAAAGKRRGALARERDKPRERRREDRVGVLDARLLPGAERRQLGIGELPHEILRQGQRLAAQTPEQEQLALKPRVALRLCRDLLHEVAKPVGHEQRVANALQRRELLAAFGASRRREHRFLVPTEQGDRLVEMAQLRYLRAQPLFQILGPADGALGDAQLGRHLRLEHGGKPAPLRDIDDLLLGDAAYGAEAVLGRGEPHHRIERLAEHAPVRVDHRELVHGKPRRRLHHPRLLGIGCTQRRLVQRRVPRPLPGGRSKHDARAAIGAVGLQHQELAVLAGIVEQVAFRVVGKRGAPVGEQPRPQHVTPEQPAVVRPEIVLAQHRIGENLEGALVIEIADERGDHAVLPEQKPHRLERPADLPFEVDELAQLIVAVRDVDPQILVEDLVARHAQFARVGMSDGEAMLAGQEFAQHGLFGRSVMDVFRLDEAELARIPPDGARVIDQHLHEQFALVPRQLDDQLRIVRQEGRQHVAHDKLLGDRRVVNAADAREVRLHEMQRILPARAGEIAHRVEPAVDRVEARMLLGPGVTEPALLVGRDRDDGSDPLVF